MSVLLMDGFDLYNGVGNNTGLGGKWNTVVGFPQQMVAGRFNGQAVQFSNGAFVAAIQKSFTAGTTFTIGFAVKLNALPGGAPTHKGHVALLSGISGNWQNGLCFDANGSVTLHRLTGPTTSAAVLATAPTGTIIANTWQYLELEVVISTTVGRMTLYCNGVNVASASGVNTSGFGSGSADTLYIGSTNGGNGAVVQIDDLYVIDAAAKLGERRIETLRPSADTATKDFTPDTGTVNFSRVNEATADATNYVQASTVGNTDLYDLGDLSSTPAAIDAVQYTTFALKTDASARNVALVGDIAGSQNQTADMVLNASAVGYSEIKATKPGGGAWTPTAVNSLRLGPKVTL